MNEARYTIDDISNTDDRVWDAACLYEDGDAKAAFDMVRDLSKVDRLIFEDETLAIDRKARVARKAAEAASGEPSGWTIRAELASRGMDYEGAILAEQEADESWWG